MAGGAPIGNTNSATGKEGRRALEIALEIHGEDKPRELIGRMRTLVMMWKPIIDKALVDGDLMAMKEINDRLDGRPRQSIDVADITEARADELSDEQLNDIATDGSKRTVEKTESKKESSGLC